MLPASILTSTYSSIFDGIEFFIFYTFEELTTVGYSAIEILDTGTSY